MPTALRRIGLFGGTFDPPHVGHLVTAVNVRHALRLDRLLLVVANDPWQKGDQAVSPAADRLAMVEAAVRGVPGLEQMFAMAGGMQAALVAGVVGGTFLSYHYVEVMWHFIGLGLAVERAAAYEVARLASAPDAAATAPDEAVVPAFGARLPVHLLPTPAVNRR